MDNDLVQFLHARFDEDEQKARAAAERIGPRWGTEVKHAPDVDSIPDAEWDNELGLPKGAIGFYGTDAEGEHLKRWAPKRVLAETEAKRELLRLAERAHDYYETFTSGFASALEQTLRRFALAYAEHPDYREEWRP